MIVTVYGIRNCDTMRKAFAWLEANGVAYEFHDYKKAGVPRGRLERWARQVGWEALANRRGPTWRRLPEAQRADPDEARGLALLEANASAIRRPIVEAGARLLIGFDAAEFTRALKAR